MYESLPADYHDPSLWTPDLQPPPAASMPFLRRRGVQTAGSGLAGLVLGVLIGASSGGGDEQRIRADRATEALAAEQADTQEQLSDARARLARAEKQSREAEAVLAKERKALQDERARLGAVGSQLEAREAAVAEQEAAQTASTEVQGIVGSAGSAESSGSADATGTAYYSNCSDARAAGAAPVRAGDSGYGRHLDRDGDGVGCE